MAKKTSLQTVNKKGAVLVGIVMGSQSDWETMKNASATLETLGISNQVAIHSAHRTPHRLTEWVMQLEKQGTKVFIAGAGMAAALPGVVAAITTKPVLGCPMQTSFMGGLDSLLSMVQMPGGIPVGVMAVGRAGAINSALLAASILGLSDPEISRAIKKFRTQQTEAVPLKPN